MLRNATSFEITAPVYCSSAFEHQVSYLHLRLSMFLPQVVWMKVVVFKKVFLHLVLAALLHRATARTVEHALGTVVLFGRGSLQYVPARAH